MLNYPRQNACICVYNNRYMYIFRGKEKNVLLETIEFLDLNNIKKMNGMCFIFLNLKIKLFLELKI
jgi:hypothetical protein